ncbi:hypothetical protein [Parapedobacter koreensis]|uniref:OmpH family outer membrane protein n=1 Tax=Parapedobacter koreensis TaxID=332977 RepID=A0A1H7TWA3_9SPHI|nr:hypothetical protein [Parapedobacter koreensis]SEL88706.1 hypothetical protein SAMN05421740_112111 [Parapedobacter koreensis]
MKTLAIIALFATANAGTAFFANATEKPATVYIVNTDVNETAKRMEAFKSQVAFHEHNVSILWQQYNLEVQRIQNRAGSHADLDRDEKFFIGLYQQDIDNGLRVAQSQKAIAEIKARYAKAHEQRAAEEAHRIAAVQTLLKKELKREAKALNKTKDAYAGLAEALPLFMEVERYVNESIERAAMLLADSNEVTIAAR